jgi:hypothetical protein
MRANMTRLGTLAALAATGVLAAAAFVRPPVSPVQRTLLGPKTAAAGTMAKAPPRSTKAAAFATAPAVSQRGFVVEQVLFAAWGAGLGELGVTRPKEANPEAPMSFAVDAEGRVHVLDQVNQRIAVFAATGTALSVVPIGSDTVQDLAVDPRGGWALLDRLVAREVRFLDRDGKVRARVPVVGPGIDEGGLVTGLFAARDGFWLEVEHTSLVRVATADGEPDPQRPTLEGRRATPTAPMLRAARDARGFAVVSATGAGGFFARVPFDAPVLSLVGLEGDGLGTTFVGAHLGRESSSFALYDEKVSVVALDAQGTEIGRFDLPPPEGPEEQLKSMVLSPAGHVHVLHVGQNGATIWRAR